MIQVEQRQLWRPASHPEGPQRGDCLRACVASVLELPYEGVPGFTGYSSGVAGWVKERFPGLGFLDQQVSRDYNRAEHLDDWRSWPRTLYRPGYWIASVYSPRIPDEAVTGCGCVERVPGGDPECEWCHGSPEDRHHGVRWGLHAVVMKNGQCAWDPHPERVRDPRFHFRSAMTFVVEDPAVLLAA